MTITPDIGTDKETIYTCEKCDVKAKTGGTTPLYWRLEYVDPNYEGVPILMCYECATVSRKKIV